MQVTRVLTDEDAVSPVLGVILMVAITVILAAVVAGFVFSEANPENPAPTVAFSYDYDLNDEQLNITVQSGGSFTAQQVIFDGIGFDDAGDSWDEEDTDSTPLSVVNTGAKAVLGDGTNDSDDDVHDGFELEIVWADENGERFTVLSTHEGPEA